MELATFKRSVLTQIICYKKLVFMCVHVHMLVCLIFDCLFICFSFVCETISPSV